MKPMIVELEGKKTVGAMLVIRGPTVALVWDGGVASKKFLTIKDAKDGYDGLALSTHVTKTLLLDLDFKFDERN